jgi:hypothetical protein
MKMFFGVYAVALLLPAAALAQERKPEPERRPEPQRAAPPAQHEVGNGHVPARGPEPYRGAERPAVAPASHAVVATYRDVPNHPEAPHVHALNDEWIGHATGRNDVHYHLDRPWQYGHFNGPIGAQHIWRIVGGTRDRFNIGGFYFGVAPYDYGFTNGWLWSSDDLTLYPDPDHDGWYLAYNVRTGTYVHVQYLGP